MADAFRTYIRQIRINARAGVQYKGWYLTLVHVFFVMVTDPLGLVFLFLRFGTIGSWTVERILLIYAIAITSFGLAETVFRGFDSFPWQMLRQGEFDRVLLRPCSLVAQVAGARFHIHRLVRVVSGSAAIVWCLSRLGVGWTAARAAALALALVGGGVMYCGVFLLTSGIAFYTIQALDWIYILSNASYQVTRIPVDHLPRALYGAFTFFLPVIVISYYPAAFVCGWGEAAWTAWLALPAGVAFYAFAYVVWRIGLRHYASTGS